MATLASDQIRWIADEWENNCGYPSAVLSGILPDERHKKQGGYHVSVDDLYKYGNGGDYSNTRPRDRDKNTKYGAAIDMSMSAADMRKCHNRMRKVWADKSDPRRKYLNAFNTWSGSGDAVRLDFITNTAKYASPDHKWHNHCEECREFVLSWLAARAIVSALRGDSKAAYLAAEQALTAPKPPPPPEDDMEQTDKLIHETDNKNRTVGQVLADLGNGRNWLISALGTQDKYLKPAAGSPLAIILTEAMAGKLRHEAIMAKLGGADNSKIIAAVNAQGDRLIAEMTARAEEDAERDAALARLYRDGIEGKLSADMVLTRLRALLPDGPEGPPDSDPTPNA